MFLVFLLGRWEFLVDASGSIGQRLSLSLVRNRCAACNLVPSVPTTGSAAVVCWIPDSWSLRDRMMWENERAIIKCKYNFSTKPMFYITHIACWTILQEWLLWNNKNIGVYYSPFVRRCLSGMIQVKHAVTSTLLNRLIPFSLNELSFRCECDPPPYVS